MGGLKLTKYGEAIHWAIHEGFASKRTLPKFKRLVFQRVENRLLTNNGSNFI